MSCIHICALALLATALAATAVPAPAAPAPAEEPRPVGEKFAELHPGGPNGLPASALCRIGRSRFLPAGGAVLTYSPDGKLLASVEGNGTIFVWDRLTGRELHCWPLPRQLRGGFGPPLHRLEFTPDSRLLVAAGRAGVRVHDLAKGKVVYKLPADPLRGAEISISPDGRRLIVRETRYSPKGGGLVPDPTILVYDLATGEKDEALTGRLARYGNAFYSPDGRVLAACVFDEKVYFARQVEFLDVQAEKKLAALDLPGRPAALLFSPDGSLFLTGGDGRGLRAWTVPDAKPAGAIPEGTLARCKVLGPPSMLDNDRFLTTGSDGVIRLWRLSTGKELWHVTPIGEQVVVPLALSPDRKVLTTGSGLRHYELSTGQDRLEEPPAGGQVAFSPSGKYLAYAPGGTVLWREPPITLTDLKSGTSVSLAGHTKPVLALGFTADEAMVVSGSTDKTVRAWATKSGKALWSFGDGPDSMTFAVSPKGGAAFSKKLEAEVLDLGTGKGRQTLTSRAGAPFTWYKAMAYSPDGTRLAAVREVTFPERRITLSAWDLSTGKEAALVELKDAFAVGSGPSALSLSPDNRFAAVIADGVHIRILDLAGGVERKLTSDEAIRAVAYSPDGKLLAVGDGMGGVTLWTSGLKKVQSFEGHRGQVAALAWSADGKLLASSSTEGSVILWDVTGKAPAPAKPKPPTPEQRQAALDKAWEDLASPSVPTAYRAMLALAADPKEGAALLKERLRPPAAPAAGDIAGLIAGLGDDAKAKADGAERALAAYGEAVRDPLRRAPANKPSVEALRRVERLLAGLDDPAQCPEALRVLRAVELLEYLDTPDAVAVLRALAREAVRKPEKADAARALERLGKRKATAKE